MRLIKRASVNAFGICAALSLGLSQGVSAAIYDWRHAHREVYQHNSYCDRLMTDNEQERVEDLQLSLQEIPQYILLGRLSERWKEFATDLLRKDLSERSGGMSWPDNLTDQLKHFFQESINKTIFQQQREFSYKEVVYLPLFRKSPTEIEFTINPALPGWEDYYQQSTLAGLSARLKSGSRAGWLSTETQTYSVDFFQRTIGLERSSILQVLNKYNSNTGDSFNDLVGLIVTMVVEGADAWFRNAMMHEGSLREVLEQYLPSVSYKVVSMLFQVLEHPEEFNSNINAEGLPIITYSPDSDNTNKPEPYAIPERFQKWSEGLEDNMGFIHLLEKYMQRKACKKHVPNFQEATF